MKLLPSALAAFAAAALSFMPAWADCSGSSPTPCGALQDDAIYHNDLTLGVPGTLQGSIKFAGPASQTFTLVPSASAGNATGTLPATAGVFVNVASPPLINTAGTLSCPACATTPAGGALSATAPVTVSAAGVIALTTPLALNFGGTNANLTASNGGVVWSNASQLQILAGTAAANLPLLSGSSASPSWATISYPASANSGGIPYFSSATAMATSAPLAANTIVVGGGAGAAPSTPGCTQDANQNISCTSSGSFLPQFVATNTANDANNAFFIAQKSRSGAAVQSGDVLGNFLTKGFTNSAYQNSGAMTFSVAAAPSGSNVPTYSEIQTSNSAGQINQRLRFDNNAHLGVTLQATAPTITAGCNGAGSSISGGGAGRDAHGTVTGQTAAAATCTVTFGASFANVPDCTFTGFQSPITAVNSVGTGSFQVTFASTANYKFSYHCLGN